LRVAFAAADRRPVASTPPAALQRLKPETASAHIGLTRAAAMLRVTGAGRSPRAAAWIEGPPSMTSITEAARAASLSGVGIGAYARHLAGTIAAAIAAWRTERALAHLDTHMLRDIGMEGTRPFDRKLPTDHPELWR
jgi:hypothetical protein